MRFSLLEILEVTGGGEVGGTQVGEMFSTFHTDSREVKPGGLFFALRGAEMDGHEFVPDALARPVIGIVTNVGVVHIEYFSSHEDLARAKGELVAALPDAGLAVLNADNQFFPLLAQMTTARVATFGEENGDYLVQGYRALD